MLKLSKFRIVTLLGAVIIIAGATVAEKGIGTFCNLCVVGFLQITAAAGAVPVGMIPGVVVGMVLVYFLGRFFCSWLCTTALVRAVFQRKATVPSSPRRREPIAVYLPFAVLTASVAISFIVQFPVFCMVCPIGLFFGFIYAVFKLFHIFEPGWNLIIFPAMLAVEILLFRRWCAYICPISAVFILLGKIPGPKFRLKVNADTCLLSKGASCRICSNNCPEGVHITRHDAEYIEHCSSCMKCHDRCPTESIRAK